MKCIVCEKLYVKPTDSAEERAKAEAKAEIKHLPLSGAGIGAKLCTEHFIKALEWAGMGWWEENKPKEQKPEDIAAAFYESPGSPEPAQQDS